MTGDVNALVGISKCGLSIYCCVTAPGDMNALGLSLRLSILYELAQSAKKVERVCSLELWAAGQRKLKLDIGIV